MDIAPIVGSVSSGFGAQAPIAPHGKNDKELKNACSDFMAVLYSYTFEQMRSSSMDEEDGLFSGENTQMFLGYLDQEVGKKLAKQDGGGLSELLYKQLSAKQKQG